MDFECALTFIFSGIVSAWAKKLAAKNKEDVCSTTKYCLYGQYFVCG
jgi:hypothetical protein